eukprot:m.306011 g.306011  ORF g.306011 m.306011 type:complete len:225 (+) comp18414_c0_seq1:756-1430(+)
MDYCSPSVPQHLQSWVTCELLSALETYAAEPAAHDVLVYAVKALDRWRSQTLSCSCQYCQSLGDALHHGKTAKHLCSKADQHHVKNAAESLGGQVKVELTAKPTCANVASAIHLLHSPYEKNLYVHIKRADPNELLQDGLVAKLMAVAELHCTHGASQSILAWVQTFISGLNGQAAAAADDASAVEDQKKTASKKKGRTQKRTTSDTPPGGRGAKKRREGSLTA